MGQLLGKALLGKGLPTDELESAVAELVSRHRLDESQTDNLIDALIISREVSQELATNAYSIERPDHRRFAADLWARFDAFWLRRAPELRMQMERRSREKLDGVDGHLGVVADLEETVDYCIRQSGVAGALDFATALLARLRTFEALMRDEHQQQHTLAQRFFQEAEGVRTALTNIGQKLDQLQSGAEGGRPFSRLWRMVGFVATFGLWRPGIADEENRARQFQELNLRVQDQRNRFLSSTNRAVEHRLAEEVRVIAAGLYGESILHLADSKDRLERIKARLEESNLCLLQEMNKWLTEIKRSPFIGGNAMRRDVTADYVDQYHQMHVQAATHEMLKWLLPEEGSALAALENHYDDERLRQKFYDRYAEDILRRKDRDGLAEMINRLHTDHAGGSLTDRIGEGLRFCLPFWDIRVPGNQFTTEVLLVGLARHHPAVENYLDAHAAAQRGDVLPQVVPTGQDSVILISRVAHGASYYWHAQDETYFREYTQALETSPYPVHLRKEWRQLPDPLPDPSKYGRRVFALGIAYEFIAIRGAAYYLDPQRHYSLADTARQDTPDWKTIPLMEATVLADPPGPAAAPAIEDRLDDDNRTEAMQKFVEVDHQVAAVREKLMELFNQQGRERMRQQIERYCREALAPAIEELGEDDRARHQLEVEWAAIEEVIAELRLAIGKLKLVR